MLFKRQFLDGIATGTVTLAFRRWARPGVREGGTLRAGGGVLRFTNVTVTTLAAITEADARHAGYASAAALRDELGAEDGRALYRIAFECTGPDPREALREDARLDAAGFQQIASRLEKLDQSRGSAWTKPTLKLISGSPGVKAAELAIRLGRERDALKIDIRKLKELGLTESLEVGYRLSPRGQAVLAKLDGAQQSADRR